MSNDTYGFTEHPGKWKPLIDLLAKHNISHELRNFMYMGHYHPHSAKKTIELYKHIITRSYINIDEQLNTYAYRPAASQAGCDAYEPITNDQAIQKALN